MTRNKIVEKFREIAKIFGVDRAIAYTIIGKGFQVVAGPITLLLIASFLTPEEQGFYYTFSSIVNVQIFFELGLSFVILQFASHEKAMLGWTEEQKLEGNNTAKERLSSLLKLAIKWYGIISVLMVTILVPAGFIFLDEHKLTEKIYWESPWTILVISTGLMLFLSPLLSFLEGCGLVAEIAYMRIAQSLFSNLFLWAALTFKLGLLAAAIPNIVSFIWTSVWIFRKYRYFFVDLLKHEQNQSKNKASFISWRHEIFPLQWRIAVSWLSGYFIYFLFTPVLFKFYGPIAAGKMGMSLSLSTAISTLSISWLSTKSSPFASLIAQKKYVKLDQMFFPTLIQSCGVAAVGGIILWMTAWILQATDNSMSYRIIDLGSLALLAIVTVMNVYVYGLSIYLRAHKKEPFLLLSVMSATLTIASTYFMGRAYGTLGMMIGYFVISCIFSIGYGSFIFYKKRKEWHGQW